jgi:hypothetical protein
VTDRKKPGWAFWATVGLLSSPVLYIASFGLWCWIVSYCTKEGGLVGVPAVFEPLTWSFRSGPLGDALERYTKVGAAGGSFWHCDGGLDPDDHSISCDWCWKCPGDG